MIASSDWMSRSCDSARPIEISMSFSCRERSSSSSIVADCMRIAIASARVRSSSSSRTIAIGETIAVRSASLGAASRRAASSSSSEPTMMRP